METNYIMPIDEMDENNKETLIKNDRTRCVSYNGSGFLMNEYSCSNCKQYYFFLEYKKHYFCPFCGTKYKYIIDVSI